MGSCQQFAWITLKTNMYLWVRLQCQLGGKSSKRVQTGEPLKIGVSNLYFTGDPNLALELAVSQGVPLSTVSSHLRGAAHLVCNDQHYATRHYATLRDYYATRRVVSMKPGSYTGGRRRTPDGQRFADVPQR